MTEFKEFAKNRDNLVNKTLTQFDLEVEDIIKSLDKDVQKFSSYNAHQVLLTKLLLKTFPKLTKNKAIEIVEGLDKKR